MRCSRALLNEIFAPLVISFSNSDTPNNEFSYQHQIDRVQLQLAHEATEEIFFFLYSLKLQKALAQKPIMKIAQEQWKIAFDAIYVAFRIPEMLCKIALGGGVSLKPALVRWQIKR